MSSLLFLMLVRPSHGILLRLQGVNVVKEKKSKNELATLVADAIESAIGHGRVMPPFIEGHIRDGMGRTWDVSIPAPTPVHRRAIDSVRDLFDLS